MIKSFFCIILCSFIFVGCNEGPPESKTKAVNAEFATCIGGDKLKSLQALKDGMYKKLASAYGLENNRQNLKQFMTELSQENLSIEFNTKDCESLQAFHAVMSPDESMWIGCLKAMNTPGKFIGDYLIVKDVDTKMPRKNFATAMLFHKMDYLLGDPLIEMAIIHELYYKELVDFDCFK